MDFNEVIKINCINTKQISEIKGLLRDPKVLVNLEDINKDTSTLVYDLLMDSVIRRGDGLILYNVQQEFKQKILEFVSKNEPIQFVFQGLPFKCHNPVETLRKTPDLGELSTFQRLVDINKTISQVYSPGVRFTVLTEGETYKGLFGASQNEVKVYQKQCKYFSKLVGAENIIQLIDFMDLVGDKDNFIKLCLDEEKLVFENEIDQFIPVMMRSLPIISKVSFEDLLSVFGYGVNTNNLTDFEKDFRSYIKNAAKDLAIKYLAIQKVKHKFDIIGSNFKDKIYISTTSKKDRYSFHPIHKKTRLYAHHGVPVLGSDKVDIVYLGEIVANPDIYTAVYYDKDIENAPFYFLKGKQHLKN